MTTSPFLQLIPLALLAGVCTGPVDKCNIEWEPQCERSDSNDTTSAEPSNGRSTNGSRGSGGDGGSGGNGGNGGGGNGGGNGGGGSGGGGSDDRANNGFGNGDQPPPGRSALHNRAENDRDGRPNPSHGANSGG